jgi:hypothetical protein
VGFCSGERLGVFAVVLCWGCFEFGSVWMSVGLTGVELFCGSHQVSPAGTGLTGGAHRSDRCWSVDSRFGVPLRSRVGRLSVDLANLCSESETCVGSHVHLVCVFISFEKKFYRLPFTPPSLVHHIGPSSGIRAGSGLY